jgi:hypothetical protein
MALRSMRVSFLQMAWWKYVSPSTSVRESYARWISPHQQPRGGGMLRYRVVVDQRRGTGHDARMTDKWAIVRLGDLFPPARVRSRVGATSSSTVGLSGPPSWSFETRYGSAAKARAVVDPDRRFDRPTGWAIAGHLGIRRDRIADRRVAVAAPVGEPFRRLDTLAFLRWTVPALTEVFPEFPGRLLVVGASDGMWRGGLSGPGSAYLHAGRPLISENGTSALLHELVHIATAPSAAAQDDWIVEGLAEYYSLEILRRTGGISERRFDRSMRTLRAWADRKKGGINEPSTGADTAWAGLKFHALADELDQAGGSLDAIVRELIRGGTLTRGALKAEVNEVLGRASVTLVDIRE